ncbi:MAG: N-acetylglucosamine kinase [Anaerolineae bacterium]
MTILMGIDGGGSHLRVVIVSPDLEMKASLTTTTANPSVIGHLKAVDVVQSAVRDCVARAGLTVEAITAVGVGIAGAAASHSEEWLREVLGAVLPNALIVPSSDIEIALVGAHGKREGVLALAGTGSVALGINTEGEMVQVGGWGYLIGDEGSGYRLGIEALHAMTRATDGRDEPTRLTERVLEILDLNTPYQIISWLYGSGVNRTREVAELAPVVLEEAEGGDVVARRIVHHAAEELAHLCETVIRRLHITERRIAFAGGILEHDNRLSRELCQMLGLEQRPTALYPPVVGAALLAKLALE